MSELNRPIKKNALIAWVKEQIKQGVPRWLLYRRLSKMQSESKDIKETLALSLVMGSLEDELVNHIGSYSSFGGINPIVLVLNFILSSSSAITTITSAPFPIPT